MRLLTNVILLGLGLVGMALSKSICVCIATLNSTCQLGIRNLEPILAKQLVLTNQYSALRAAVLASRRTAFGVTAPPVG